MAFLYFKTVFIFISHSKKLIDQCNKYEIFLESNPMSNLNTDKSIYKYYWGNNFGLNFLLLFFKSKRNPLRTIKPSRNLIILMLEDPPKTGSSGRDVLNCLNFPIDRKNLEGENWAKKSRRFICGKFPLFI